MSLQSEFLHVLAKDMLSSVSVPREAKDAITRGDVAEMNLVADKIRAEEIDVPVRSMRPILIALSCLKKVPGATHQDRVIAEFTARMASQQPVHIPSRYYDVLRRYISSVLDEVEDFIICHGPGATAEKAIADDKWFYMRAVPNKTLPLCHMIDPLKRVPWTVKEAQSRVLVVEKDYRGGRIIAAEPTVLQFFQQGIGSGIFNALVKRGYHLLDSQRHAEYMLKFGFGATATIDLKDASDRLQWSLIEELFPNHWVELLQMSRSESLKLPNGDTIPNTAAATMGNGFCFPILTLVCGAACAAVTGDWSGRTWSVFGDDIILPEGSVDRVIHLLACFGLSINHGKSFRGQTKFRESCGVDLFEGYAVRPIFLRGRLGGDIKDAVKGLQFAHKMWALGCQKTARFVSETFTDSVVGYGLPHNGWAPAAQIKGPTRWSRTLHRMEAATIGFRDPDRVRNLDEPGSWLQSTFKRDRSERSVTGQLRDWDLEVLTRTGIPHKKWAPI